MKEAGRLDREEAGTGEEAGRLGRAGTGRAGGLLAEQSAEVEAPERAGSLGVRLIDHIA